VSENNLGGTGTILGGALAIADQQIGLRTRVFLPRVAGSPITIGGEALFNQARDFFGNRDVLVDDRTQPVSDFAVVRYKRFGGRVSVGYELSPATHLALDYRLEGIDAELPAAASHRRGADIEPIDFHIQRGGSLLSGLRATFVHDTRDEPLLTTRGWFTSLVADGAFAGTGSSYSYFKIQGKTARWMRLPWGHVVRVEGWAGALFGDAPLFERFYVGDLTDLLPHRVLELAFDRRPAPNFFGTAIGDVRYGDFAARLTGEYRLPLYRGHSAIYGVDLFGSGGVYLLATPRELSEPSRQWQAAARVPIDLTFNLGVRVDTAIGGMNLGLSTLIGFIPLRGGTQ
jgi:outer membrane protein assembly factor BamA